MSRTAEKVGEHGPGRLVAPMLAKTAAGAAHKQRSAAGVEAPEAALRQVLLAAAVTEVHEQLMPLQCRCQLCCRRHRTCHTLHASEWRGLHNNGHLA